MSQKSGSQPSRLGKRADQGDVGTIPVGLKADQTLGHAGVGAESRVHDGVAFKIRGRRRQFVDRARKAGQRGNENAPGGEQLSIVPVEREGSLHVLGRGVDQTQFGRRVARGRHFGKNQSAGGSREFGSVNKGQPRIEGQKETFYSGC